MRRRRVLDRGGRRGPRKEDAVCDTSLCYQRQQAAHITALVMYLFQYSLAVTITCISIIVSIAVRTVPTLLLVDDEDREEDDNNDDDNDNNDKHDD